MNHFPSSPVNGPRDSVSGAPPLPAATTHHHDHDDGTPGGHGGHGWAMWLMCVPMLLIVGLLILSGSAGFGAAIYALACLGMMAAMMLFVQHGTRR